jgi:Amino acid permease
MSEAGHVPFTETKLPESPERLHRGALRLIDIAASTMANIGPAYSFYFGFGLLVITAGIAAPLTIVAAIVAIALLGNTLSQFARAHPSTGGFITFVGKTFGGTSAVTTALLAGAGYIVAISSVLVIAGGFTSMLLQYYFNVSIPWIIFSVAFTAGAMVMMVRGVAVSTKLAGFFFGFELLVLFVVAIATLVKNGGHLSFAPFEPRNITNGFSGLAAGFPLAVYLFIGWENSAALAEETSNPRRNVPRAVFMSIGLMAATYLIVAYSTVTGFHYNGKALAGAEIPFISVAHSVAAWLAFIAYLAGMTSTLGVLIAAVNSQCRLIFKRRAGGPAAALDRPGPPGPPDAGQRHLHVRHASQRDRRRLGPRPPDRRAHQQPGRAELLLRVGHDGHDPDPGRVLPRQPGPAVLLPQVPAAGVQRGQARDPAGPRHGRHRGAGVLPVQAGPARPVRLVPLRRPGRPGAVHPVRRLAGPTRSGHRRPRRLDRRRRIAAR